MATAPPAADEDTATPPRPPRRRPSGADLSGAGAAAADSPPYHTPGSGGASAGGMRSSASIARALDDLDAQWELAETGPLSHPLSDDDDGDGGGPLLLTPRAHRLTFRAQYGHIAVVTTAALPWMTGTAVNPALRAAYLRRRGHRVTLLVPWLPPEQQAKLYPAGLVFDSHDAQRAHILAAIARRVPFALDADLRVAFYPGRYDAALGSILPDAADLQALVPRPCHLVVLEEPEHLTWYHTGRRWKRAFPVVVGVMHTNYVRYVGDMAGESAAALIARLNRFLVRAHCHKAVKLSDAVQALPRQETCFVHGVADAFIAVGLERARLLAAERAAREGGGGGGGGRQQQQDAGGGKKGKKQQQRDEGGAPQGGAPQGGGAAPGAAAPAGAPAAPAPAHAFSRGAYFLGKAVWPKGYAELLDRLSEHAARCAAAGRPQPHLDAFGSGEHAAAIARSAAARGLDVSFPGARDHLAPEMAEYKVFVNPSTSDVVATTSAEALAMGKWLVVPAHPCNEWLSTFPNCLVYEDSEGFSAALERALATDPAPLTADDAARLSWEHATDRFLHCAADVDVGKGGVVARVGGKTAWLSYNVVVGAIESVRRMLARASARAAEREAAGGSHRSSAAELARGFSRGGSMAELSDAGRA